jgi:hypothetical protein
MNILQTGLVLLFGWLIFTRGREALARMGQTLRMVDEDIKATRKTNGELSTEAKEQAEELEKWKASTAAWKARADELDSQLAP